MIVNYLVINENQRERQENCQIDWNIKPMSGDSCVMMALKDNMLELFKLLYKIPTIDWETTDEQGHTLEKVARYLILYSNVSSVAKRCFMFHVKINN